MSAATGLEVRQGSSRLTEPEAAIAELAARIHQDDASVVILFCSNRYDRTRLAESIARHFKDGCVIGCTTAGEIDGEQGYVDQGIVGASLRSPGLTAHPRLIDDLDHFDFTRAATLAEALEGALTQSEQLDPARQFGLLLIDGLAMREETVAAALFESLKGVGLVGGSAGDDLRFAGTAVYHQGRFHEKAALFTLFESRHPFHLFRFQHFEPSETRLVTTDADPANRRVREIDGMPAVEAYSRAIGVPVADFDASVFANHPLMLKVGGGWYIRSVQKANDDGSLTFYCAIDEGLVLTLGRGTHLDQSIARDMTTLRDQHGEPAFMLACDCIFRRLELADRGTLESASSQLKGLPLIGFSTYGEQYQGLHINQTLTGVMLAAGDEGGTP